jgi:hypothetical protein
MTPVVVSTSAGLVAALKGATGGAVILLAPGPWTPVVISDVKIAGTVTISSQDPARPAVLPGLVIQRSEGLNLTAFTLATELFHPIDERSVPMPFKILNSRRIRLDGLNIHGTLDGNPQNDVNGLLISDSDQISVAHCEFQQFFNALTEYRNTNLTISSNKFHDIRDDGIDNAGSSNVTISDNHFSDFYPVNVGPKGDHPDAIQFWTSNTKEPAHDIVITGNTFERGRGSWIQGIFVTDQIGLPYQRVTITHNSISGGMTNGIMAAGCTDLTIADNKVQPYPDMMSWIRVEKCSSAKISHNRAGKYILKDNDALEDNHNDSVEPAEPRRRDKP